MLYGFLTVSSIFLYGFSAWQDRSDRMMQLRIRIGEDFYYLIFCHCAIVLSIVLLIFFLSSFIFYFSLLISRFHFYSFRDKEKEKRLTSRLAHHFGMANNSTNGQS